MTYLLGIIYEGSQVDFALLCGISLPSYSHRTNLHVKSRVSGRCQDTVNFSCSRSEPDGQNHPPRPLATATAPTSLSKGHQKASGPTLRPYYNAQQNTAIFKMWEVSLKLHYVFTEPHIFLSCPHC